MLRSARLLIVLPAAMAVAACNSGGETPDGNMVAPPIAEQPPAVSAIVPGVDQPLERRDLLLAAMEAGSNHALGLNDRAEQQKLDGRTFTFRLRLCGDAANVKRSFDEPTRILKVEVEPDIGSDSPIAAQLNAQGTAVEGFWVPHPYLLGHGCPRPAVTAAGTGQAGSDRQQVAIAQFFGTDEVRADQRGARPYSITEELAEGEAPGAVDLVLGGRLQRLGSGKVISCVDSTYGERPTCVISVKLDRVQLQTANGKLLGEWSRS